MNKELALRGAGIALAISTAVFRPEISSAQALQPQTPPIAGEPVHLQNGESLDPTAITFTSYDGQQMAEETILVVGSTQFEIQKPVLPDEKKESTSDFNAIKDAADTYLTEQLSKGQTVEAHLPEADNLLFMPTIENVSAEQAEFQERYDRITQIYKKWQPNAIFFLMYNDGGGVISVIDPQKKEFYDNDRIRNYLKEVQRDLEYMEGVRDELIRISEDTGIDRRKFNVTSDVDMMTLLLTDQKGKEGSIEVQIDPDNNKWMTTTVSLSSVRYMRAEAVTTALPAQYGNTIYSSSWHQLTVDNQISIESQSNTTDIPGIKQNANKNVVTNAPGGMALAAIATQKAIEQEGTTSESYQKSIEEQAMRLTISLLNKLGLTDTIPKEIFSDNPNPDIQKIHAHVLAVLATLSQLESPEIQTPAQTDDFHTLIQYIKNHTPSGVIPNGYGWEGIEYVLPRVLSHDEIQLLRNTPISSIIDTGSTETVNRKFSIDNIGIQLVGTEGNYTLQAKSVAIDKNKVKVYAQIQLPSGANAYVQITDYCVTELTEKGIQKFECPKEVNNEGTIIPIGEFIVTFGAQHPFTNNPFTLGVHVPLPIDHVAESSMQEKNVAQILDFRDYFLFQEGTEWRDVEEHLIREYAGEIPSEVQKTYKTAFDGWERSFKKTS